MTIQIYFIILILVIDIFIMYKNTKNEFQPYLKPKVGLFCVGFITLFFVASIVEGGIFWPEIIELIIFGILVGLGLIFSTPRYWEWLKNKKMLE